MHKGRLSEEAAKSQADQTSIALEIAERSAKAAEDSARTASQSITRAKESMQLTLRAYVTIDEILPVNQNAQKAPAR